MKVKEPEILTRKQAATKTTNHSSYTRSIFDSSRTKPHRVILMFVNFRVLSLKRDLDHE